MKKVIVGLVLAGVLGSALPAFAQVATSTATTTAPTLDGHRVPHVASTIDSTSTRGAWYISNVFPDFGRLVYIAEQPSEFSNWRTYFLGMHYK